MNNPMSAMQARRKLRGRWFRKRFTVSLPLVASKIDEQSADIVLLDSRTHDLDGHLVKFRFDGGGGAIQTPITLAALRGATLDAPARALLQSARVEGNQVIARVQGAGDRAAAFTCQGTVLVEFQVTNFIARPGITEFCGFVIFSVKTISKKNDL